MSRKDRLAQFKNHGRDIESGRQHRQEDVIELRKTRKDEQLFKRRNIELEVHDLVDIDESDNNNPFVYSTTDDQYTASDVENIVKELYSRDMETMLRFTRISRRVLSTTQDPPIAKFVELNAVPRLTEFLKASDRPDLQYEATWALTNILSGTADQTKCVVDAGACPLFITLLQSEHHHVAEQALWPLANIAGDGPECRDLLIGQGVIPALIKFMTDKTSPSLLANVSWCFSNLCRGKSPFPPVEAITECLPAIKHLLMHESQAVVVDACYALVYISENGDRIQQVIDQPDVLDRLVSIISSSNDRKLIVPALRTLGNTVTGTEIQTQAVIDHGALPAFRRLVADDTLNLCKDMAWVLSNITAGDESQIQAVIDAGFVPFLIEQVKNGTVKAQKEATWALCNITFGGSFDQIALLIREGALRPLIDMLTQSDPKIIMVVLDSLMNVLLAADKMNQREFLCETLEEMGLLEHLERYQEHENEQISVLAIKLVDEYWPELEPTNEAAVGVTENSQQFVFNPTDPGFPNTQFQF